MSFISRASSGAFSNTASPTIIHANTVHKVFDLLSFVDKLPLQIECMTCYDNIFIIGTNCGRMLINEVKINNSLPSKIETVFEKSISTTKKPIIQLEAIKAFNILIALFDSQLHVFDLAKLQLLYSIPKTKGCSSFATSISADQKMLRLCVTTKKKLQFFYTNIMNKNTTQFMELTSDLDLNDLPKNVKFTKDDLIVFSLKRDYYYYEIPATGLAANVVGGGKLPETRFSTGTRQIEPLCEKLHNEFFALGVDENKTIIYDTKGKPYLEYPILWSSSPSAVCSIGPYMIGILPGPNLIEVMTIQPTSTSVQIIEFGAESGGGSSQTTPRVGSQGSQSSFLPSSVSIPVFAVTGTMNTLAGSLTSTGLFSSNSNNSSVSPADRLKILKSNGNSICYIATQSHVWCLVPFKINDQLEQILRYKNYELGLNLISSQMYFNQTTDNPFANTWANNVNKQSPSRANRSDVLTPFFSLRKALVNEIDDNLIRKITNLNALDLFCKKRFNDSLQLFQTMNTDPSHIIAFIPGLLPDAYRNKLKFDDYYPALDAKELEEAIERLIDYLQYKRSIFKDEYFKEEKEAKLITDFILTPLMENRPVLKTRKQILQIIETTLLKCYLKTKENLVPIFLRTCDNNDKNFLHLEEAERLLSQHNKISELTILYEKKEAHEKALSLLVTESTKTSSPLYGQKYLIDYMKKLGNKNIELIFKYSKCVIEADANKGLKVFVGDSVKIDEILARRAREKEKLLHKKKMSSSNIKSVIGNKEWSSGSSVLSTLLKINNGDKQESSGDNPRQSLLKNEHGFEDDDDDGDDENQNGPKSLDHEEVCSFFKEKIEPKYLSINLIRLYLQYCIFVWNDKSVSLNNMLLETYTKFIETTGRATSADRQAELVNNTNAVFINSLATSYKQMLIYFLTETKNYEPLFALSKLDLENYPEERAIVLGKQGKHHDALSIYVKILNDTDKAEAYCANVFENAKTQECKEVYYTLLQIYLNSDYEEIRIGSSMKLLNSHSNEIGSCRSLELLPADLMKCKNLSPFFETMLKRLTRNKHNTQIINRLMFALELQIHETKIMCQVKKFIVNDEQICKECNKRMGKSAMVRFPNGDLIHYGCSKSSLSFAKRSSH